MRSTVKSKLYFSVREEFENRKNSGNVFDKVSGDYFCKSAGEISEISQNCRNVGYIIPDISLASTYDIFFWHLMFWAGCLLFLEGFEILFFCLCLPNR